MSYISQLDECYKFRLSKDICDIWILQSTWLMFLLAVSNSADMEKKNFVCHYIQFLQIYGKIAFS